MNWCQHTDQLMKLIQCTLEGVVDVVALFNKFRGEMEWMFIHLTSYQYGTKNPKTQPCAAQLLC